MICTVIILLILFLACVFIPEKVWVDFGNCELAVFIVSYTPRCLWLVTPLVICDVTLLLWSFLSWAPMPVDGSVGLSSLSSELCWCGDGALSLWVDLSLMSACLLLKAPIIFHISYIQISLSLKVRLLSGSSQLFTQEWAVWTDCLSRNELRSLPFGNAISHPTWVDGKNALIALWL